MKNDRFPLTHILILIGVMLGSVCLFYLLFKGLVVTNKLKAEVALVSANQARLDKLILTMPTLSSEFESLKKTLPSSEEEVAQFAAYLELVAKEQDLVITINFNDFPKSSVISGKKMETLVTDVTLEGSYGGVTNFVKQISNSNYFYKIDKLSIARQEPRLGVKAVLNGLLIMNYADLL